LFTIEANVKINSCNYLSSSISSLLI